MGEYGPASRLVEGLVARAGQLTMDDASDLYRARASHLLIHGSGRDREALALARRAAAVAHLEDEYWRARHDAVTAWRHALPATQGPWLVVGQAIGNAAGALVVQGHLDHKAFQQLIGPWRQAMGTLVAVGPGLESREPVSSR